MSSGWIELEFVVEGERVDAWSEALLAAGAAAVQVEDADADGPLEQALFGEPGGQPPASGWPRSRLRVMVADDPDASQPGATVLARAAAIAGEPVPAAPDWRPLAEQDWVRQTQAQFEPIEIGPRLRISPSWHEIAESDRVRTIVLDPGLAFGTGSHPTTRMCLRWLERRLPAGASVIDYGCGSGILAIASARLGARAVTAIDIDDQALVATAANAAANAVRLDIRSSHDPAPAPADLVLANILASPLRLLAPMLESLALSGGTILLAGLLEHQIDEVAACYARCRMEVAEIDEGWACLQGTRQA